jgi:hypothetical protein
MTRAYYTLNRIPEGDRIIPSEPQSGELCASPVPDTTPCTDGQASNCAAARLESSEGDRTILLGTLPGHAVRSD